VQDYFGFRSPTVEGVERVADEDRVFGFQGFEQG
jgi:hypothetical protein